MRPRSVLITNGTSDAGVFTAGSLAQAGYRVLSADPSSVPFGIRSRFIGETHPVSVEDEAKTAQDLRRIIESRRPDVLLPLGTFLTWAAVRQQSWIASAGTSLCVPSEEAFRAAFDKRTCMAECLRLGIPHARVYEPADARDLMATSRGQVSLVVKPDIDAGGSAGVRYVRSRQELDEQLARCESRFGGALIQEHIGGGPGCMYSVTLFFAAGARLKAAFTMRKLRELPFSGGLTAWGESICDESLVRQVLPFFARWNWCGGAEVELKRDADGVFRVIEVNPRFPGTLRFAGECGLAFPAVAAQAALHPESPSLEYPAYAGGVHYLAPGLFAESLIQQLRQGRISVAEACGEAVAAMRGKPGPVSPPPDRLPAAGRVLARLFGPLPAPAVLRLRRGAHKLSG